jgi:hypothetical protein
MYASTTQLQKSDRFRNNTDAAMYQLHTIPCSGSELGAVRKQESITEPEKRRESHHRHAAVPGTNGSKWEGREGDLIPVYLSVLSAMRPAIRFLFAVAIDGSTAAKRHRQCVREDLVYTGMSVGLREFTRGTFPLEQDETDPRVRQGPSEFVLARPKACTSACACSTARQIRKLRTCGVIPGNQSVS